MIKLLKFVPDWFATRKMVKKFNNVVFSNDEKLFDDVDSNIVTFLSDAMGFNTIDLNSINLDDGDFDEDDPETINCVRFMA